MESHFEYLRPGSTKEALQMKSEFGDRAKFWAGGTDMVLRWHREIDQFSYCIDITYLNEMSDIAVGKDSIRIGALVSLSTLERAADQHHILKTLSDVTKLMCTPQTRTLATVGGNLINASPAADLTPPFIAMDSLAEIATENGTRTVPMDQFFKGVNKTVVADDLLSTIVIPLPENQRKAARYHRIDRTVVDIALVNASTSISVDRSNTITRAGVALGAVAPIVVRSPAAEKFLQGKSIESISQSDMDEAGEIASLDGKPISDVRASAQYRQAMIKVMTARCIKDCVEQLRGMDQ
ncbi:MAG: FAD binding domain-containing protein [Acidiferrobacterales bacterium]|nr:FAD binding domain-containing protein [Acidiferrobacterales bacterium]